MDFKRDGILKINNFLEQNIISSINNEVDKISDKIILNGNLKGAVHFNKNYLEVINPVCNIDSINLLELAVDVFLEFKKNQDSSDELKLTKLRLLIEKKNSFPLDWHTDSNNSIRAILYLRGGDINNGSLGYIKGTHKINNFNTKKLNYDILKDYKNSIENFNSKAGDLIIFDINGFHKKNYVLNERRIIIFEFQKIDSSLPKSRIFFDNKALTEKVINYISLFITKPNNNDLTLPMFSEDIPVDTPLKVFVYSLKIFLSNSIKKILRKFK
jgi:hypothetical protein